MISKERILEKTEELFIRHGIKRITMDDIASNLGISKKTIYQFFADKNEIVSVIFEKQICTNRESCLSSVEKADNAVHEILLCSGTFCSNMQSMNRHVLFDLEKYHPDVFKRFLQFKDGFLYEMVRQNLERGIREELYRDDIDLEVITRFRLYNMLLPMNGEVYPEQTFSFSRTEWELVTHYLSGIATTKGLQVIKLYSARKKTKEFVLN